MRNWFRISIDLFKGKVLLERRIKMNDPNNFQCDICGNTLTSESCFCDKCKSWLCNGCVFEDECEERQG